jgi:hypothetical protein
MRSQRQQDASSATTCTCGKVSRNGRANRAAPHLVRVTSRQPVKSAAGETTRTFDYQLLLAVRNGISWAPFTDVGLTIDGFRPTRGRDVRAKRLNSNVCEVGANVRVPGRRLVIRRTLNVLRLGFQQLTEDKARITYRKVPVTNSCREHC